VPYILEVFGRFPAPIYTRAIPVQNL